MDALKAAGFPEKQIYQVPTKSNDIPGAFDAGNSLLVQHPEVKHWLVLGMNDNTNSWRRARHRRSGFLKLLM